MRPCEPSSGKNDLFRERLDAIINSRHPLARLSGLMAWSRFDEAFGHFYRPIGRPAKPTRLMVGLHYLKHVYDLSDEEVVDRWVENPYWQFFCGFEFFQHEAPLDASTMTRWRKRIGPEGLEDLLKASVEVALDTGTAKPSSLERITVDTTVQPKAIVHPTDSRLYLKARFARLLGLVERLLAQKPKDKNKLYSLHAPEVVCISKGKARTPYEFGCKVGIATTNREGLVLASRSFEGNPYDGHTLKATVDQAKAMSGVDPDRIYVDKGYRGHDYKGSGSVMIAGGKRGLSATMKRELKRR